MKKTFCLFSALALLLGCLLLPACKQKAVSASVNTPTGAGDRSTAPLSYEIRSETGNGMVLRLTGDPAFSAGNGDEPVGISFATLEELRTAVLEKQLTDAQIRTLFREKQEIRIPDLSAIFEPTLPENWRVSDAGLQDGALTFGLAGPSGAFGYWRCFADADLFETQVWPEYSSLGQNPSVRILEEKEIGETVRTEYETDNGRFRSIRYEIESGSVWYVDENYTLQSYQNTFAVSDEIPRRVTLYSRETSAKIVLFQISEKPELSDFRPAANNEK